MESLLQHAGSSTLTATILAAAALLSGWLCRRPALTHALWLLVLAKLATPGMAEIAIPVPWIASVGQPSDEPSIDEPAKFKTAKAASPSTSSESHSTSERPRRSDTLAYRIERFTEFLFGSDARRLTLGPTPSPSAARDEASPKPDKSSSGTASPAANANANVGVNPPTAAAPSSFLLGVWWAGSIVWFAWSAFRVWRFRRWMKHGWLAPREIQRLTEGLAKQMGLRAAPQVFLAAAPISPMIFWWGRAPRLLFPSELACRLERPALESLLQHELAHLRRRDHWVRLLELFVTGLFWWHPLVWVAKRQLHAVEEECCDALVVAQSPSGRRTYALALMAAIDYLAEWRPAFPPAACGLGAAGLLRKRLLAIMRGRAPGRLTNLGRVVVGAACCTLPFSIVPRPIAASPTAAQTLSPLATVIGVESMRQKIAERILSNDAASPAAPGKEGRDATLESAVVGATASIAGPRWADLTVANTSYIVQGDSIVAARSVDSEHRIAIHRAAPVAKQVIEIVEARSVAALSISPRGEWLVWVSAGDVVKFADTGGSDTIGGPAPAPFYIGEPAVDIALSVDLSVLAIAHASGEVTRWRTQTAEPIDRLPSLGSLPSSLSLSADGAVVAAVVNRVESDKTSCAVWRSSVDAALLASQDADTLDAVVSSDGRLVGTLDSAGSCRLYDLGAGPSTGAATKLNVRPALASVYHRLEGIGLKHDGGLVSLSNIAGNPRLLYLGNTRRRSPASGAIAPFASMSIDAQQFRILAKPLGTSPRLLVGVSRDGEHAVYLSYDSAGRPEAIELWK